MAISTNMKARIVVVSWVCGRDKELIPLQLQAIRRLDPDCPVYYVFDKDDDLPKPYDENTFILKSYFPRNRNLNGAACVFGMMQVYSELLGKYGNVPIIKLDADTVLTSLSWVNDIILGNIDAAGFHCSNGYYFSGCCYSISTICAEKIRLYMETHGNLQISASYHMPEDQVITMIAALTGNRIRIMENSKDKPHCIPFLDMMSGPNGIYGVQHTLGAIHCGQYNRLDPLLAAGLDRTCIVKRDMRTCMRFLYGKPVSTRYSEIPLHSAISKNETEKNY